ncbi:MAG: glycosyltransferase family 4 protein [Bacteroidota bacterium]|nr:glycosyltransferase family 4 protein [Bacteroidota bacterium]
MRKLLTKFSHALAKAHRYIQVHILEKNRVAPRVLKYQPVTDRPKIIHINANFVIGGTSQLIADIIERTAGQYTHQVIVPDYPRPLPYQPLPILEFPVTEMTALFNYLEKERPALVHIHYWIRPMHRYYSFGLWYDAVFKICEDLQLKVIQNINVPTHPFRSPAIVHNIFVSRYVKEQFNDQPHIDSSVIYPGSDLSHFTCPDEQPFPADTIGMVYRLDADKLNGETIEIFIAALKKKPDLTCYIIGGGYYLNQYKKRVKEEGLVKQFIFTGFISYDLLPSYYKKIGLIVAPVHDESFGQVTPFAMSMGLPVVGYDTGALSEILGGKEMLADYGDTDALANLIVETVNNPAQKKKWGLANKNRVHAFFSVEKMIEEYVKLYESCMS